MPKTKMTREKWSNHMHYAKYVYIILALGAWFLTDIAYTMSAYRPPKERKVEIMIVGEYAEVEPLAETAAQALADGQAFDETLEEVDFLTILYSGEEDDIYGAQKYMVMIAAQEGDIYLLNRPLMEQLAMQGGLLPLEGYIEQGVLDPGDVDLLTLTYAEPPEREDDPPTGVSHVYAIPVSGLGKMLDLEVGYDVRDKYAVIMAYCVNPDTTAHVLGSLTEQLTGPLPDWLAAQDEARAELAAMEEAARNGKLPEPDADSPQDQSLGEETNP